MVFKKYSLSSNEIVKIARLCNQEQGGITGVKAEASQGANLLETNEYYRNKFGGDIYNFFRKSQWYSRSEYWMDYGTASEAQIAAVRDVLCNGNRIFPWYVDEHDCISDIRSISTGDKNDKSDYISGKTIIKNAYGSTYTFYSFPASGCDPFGYTAAAYKYAIEHGWKEEEPVEPVDDRISVTAKLPEIGRGMEGSAVEIWQKIIGVNADGDFGPATQAATTKFQSEHSLKSDGIVGKKTWKAGLETLEAR